MANHTRMWWCAAVVIVLGPVPFLLPDNEPTYPTVSAAILQGDVPVEVQAPGLNLCGERSGMVADLRQQFREHALATGLVDEDAIVEIFVSPIGTWTILATGTDGVSCVLAVGEGFEANVDVLYGDPS